MVTRDESSDTVSICPNPHDSSVELTYATYQKYCVANIPFYKCDKEWYKNHPVVVCITQEKNRIMAIVENKYPVYMMQRHMAHYKITPHVIQALHSSESMEWLKSRCLRRMDHPEVMDTYVETEPVDQAATQNEIERALRVLMKRRFHWVTIPDPNLIQTKDNVESATIEKMFQDNSQFVQMLLEIPTLFPAFAKLKNTRKITQSTTNDLLSLMELEYAHVAGKIPFSETNMCVGCLDNPFFRFTKMSPENQDKALSLVTHGISDMVDYSKGAYLAGSMIVAAIQYIKKR